MESEFEPTVRKEDTHDAHIVEIDLPGFRREDVKVQVNNRGSLVISGERGAKEITKVGGKSEKVQRRGNRFRKVIDVPQNLNFDSVSAKFSDARLRVSLPLHQDQKRFHFPALCSSTISMSGVLIASTVLVASVGFYITYKSRSLHSF